MKSFSRFLVIVLAATILSLTFATVQAQDQPVTLNLWVFLDGSGFVESVVSAFEAQYPNITVSITDVPEDSYVTKIDTAILAGQPPDIGFPYARRWIKAGYMQSLDDALAAQNINLNDYNAGAISRNCLVDGHLYCLGTYTGATELFYNKDMFDAAGIPYPSATEPMTIDQYAEIAQKLSTPSDNVAERVWGGNGPRFWWFDWRNYFSEDGHTAVGFINDEATVHSFQVIADLYRSGAVLTETDLGTATPSDLMVTGQLAMAVTDTVLAQPQLEAAGIRWGAAPPPVEQSGDLPWVYTGSDELGVFSSAHLEEATLFVLFYGTEGNQMRLAQDGLPLDMQMAVDQNWAGDSEGRQEMLAALQTSRPSPFIPDGWSVLDPMTEALDGLMVEDGVSAQEALDETAPIIQDNLEQAWVTWDQIQPKQ